jgi:hypothetical protein
MVAYGCLLWLLMVAYYGFLIMVAYYGYLLWLLIMVAYYGNIILTMGINK